MSDIFTKRKRSDVMSHIRGAGNKATELRLIQVFQDHAITGWRRGSKLPGKPDFVFPKLKVAVFVDGCFWHGCPRHATWPKTKARDRRVNRELRKRGWRVIRIWEHELRRNGENRLRRRLRSHLG
jgi:DNA mismatch endonuclease, patch repair protein